MQRDQGHALHQRFRAGEPTGLGDHHVSRSQEGVEWGNIAQHAHARIAHRLQFLLGGGVVAANGADHHAGRQRFVQRAHGARQLARAHAATRHDHVLAFRIDAVCLLGGDNVAFRGDLRRHWDAIGEQALRGHALGDVRRNQIGVRQNIRVQPGFLPKQRDVVIRHDAKGQRADLAALDEMRERLGRKHVRGDDGVRRGLEDVFFQAADVHQVQRVAGGVPMLGRQLAHHAVARAEHARRMARYARVHAGNGFGAPLAGDGQRIHHFRPHAQFGQRVDHGVASGVVPAARVGGKNQYLHSEPRLFFRIRQLDWECAKNSRFFPSLYLFCVKYKSADCKFLPMKRSDLASCAVCVRNSPATLDNGRKADTMILYGSASARGFFRENYRR